MQLITDNVIFARLFVDACVTYIISVFVCVFVVHNSSCDADPSALAKYVVALVKKDKTEKELKALCIDQLDVFLQKGN